MKPEKHDDCKCSGNSLVRSKGEYTIIVDRIGFKTLADLPYPIWGTLYLQSQNFATAIKDYLPTGITCTSTVVDGVIILDYTDGTNTDRIKIFAIPSGLLSYPEMLTGLNTAYIKSELCYFANNAPINNHPTLTNMQNQRLQAQPLYLSKIGGLGSKANELITPLTRKLPNNSVQDTIEISLRKQDIMADTVWIHTFGYINMTEKSKLRFYWQIIYNDVINLNKKAFNM